MYQADSLFASRKKSRDNRRSSREIPGYLHAEKISFRFVSLSFRSKLFKLSESVYYFTFHRTAFLREKKDEKNNKAKSPRLTSRRFPRNFPSLRLLLSSAVSSNFQENDTPFHRPRDSPPPFCHAANVIQLFMVTSSVRPYQQVTPVYNCDETKRIVS